MPAWAKLLTANDPGNFPAPATEPLLIIQGGNDEQIPVASTQILFDQLCKIGQVEQRWIYPGQSHAGVIGPSFGDMLHWINDRFAGGPTPDPYAPTGQARRPDPDLPRLSLGAMPGDSRVPWRPRWSDARALARGAAQPVAMTWNASA